MSQEAQNNAALSNHYAPPQAELQHQDEFAAGFYILGKTKFWLLFLTTAGIYGLYWFYRQWQAQKEQDRSSIRPIARAIFSIFSRYH